MQNYSYESPRLEILFLAEEIVRTSENVMFDPYNFITGDEKSQFENTQFGQ